MVIKENNNLDQLMINWEQTVVIDIISIYCIIKLFSMQN